MARVFISYRRNDSAGHAGRLFDRLRQHLDGDSILMDIETIKPGEDFVEAVSEAARSSDIVIVIMGRRWLTITDDAGRRRLDDPNDIVRLEIKTALEHKNVRVIPTLVDGASMPRREEVPADLETFTRLNALEISNTRFDHDVERLIENLRNAIDASKSSTPPVATSAAMDERLPADSSPKYYIYVSDQKVDMLYAQIPDRTRRALQAELGLSGRPIDSSGEPSERYSRLRVVAGYIDRNFDVGTVDNPQSYFRGVHEMRWGPYGQAKGRLLGKFDMDAKIVYFGGSTEKTHFGLGGGLHHVIGNEQGNTPVVFHSSTPYLVSALSDEVSNRTDETWWMVHKWIMRIEDQSDALDEVKALWAVMNANNVRGPRQRLEFLAKRLLYRTIPTSIAAQNGEEHVVLLGSPIYVALADAHVEAD